MVVIACPFVYSIAMTPFRNRSIETNLCLFTCGLHVVLKTLCEIQQLQYLQQPADHTPISIPLLKILSNAVQRSFPGFSSCRSLYFTALKECCFLFQTTFSNTVVA